MIDQVVRLTNRRPAPVSKICDKLGVSVKELRGIVSGAKADGYQVSIVDGYVLTRTPIGAGELVTLGAATPGRYSVPVFTDLHAGSAHFNRDALLDFLWRAYDGGARYAVTTGDLLDGNKDVLLSDQSIHTFDGQCEELVETFREAPPFKGVVAIDGNHDGYFSSSIGFISGKLLETRMREAGVKWHFAGVCLGRANIHGARWHLWHPMGGATTRNAVRRILNARAESLEERADILAMGHFHKFVSLPIYPEGVHGIAGGCFQEKKSEFANRITNGWDVGGTLVSYTVGKKGSVAEISAEFIPAK